MFEMREEYYTGIEEIDKEHQELFRIAREAYEIYKDDYIVDKYDYIIKIYQELKDYAIYHFAHEEAYMEKIGYKKRLSHKIEHDDFLAQVEELDILSLDMYQSKTLYHLLEFISNWLVNHILQCDKKISVG